MLDNPALPALALRHTPVNFFDWKCILVVLLATFIVIPRAVFIVSYSSPAYDDQYHISRGLLVLTGAKAPMSFNDPPLGETITALPLYVLGIRPPFPGTVWGSGDIGPLHEHYNPYFTSTYHPYTLMMIVAVWKALLFIPTLWLVFVWIRAAFTSNLAGCLATLLLALDPNLAAHIHTGALDILAMQSILLVAFCCWQFLQSPTSLRAAFLAAVCAAAMAIKHTAIISPVVCLVLILGKSFTTQGFLLPRELLNRLAIFLLVGVLTLWAATLFDISQPRLWGRSFPADYSSVLSPSAFFNDWMVRPIPAGTYFGSVAEAIAHGADGHPAYLLGEIRSKGGWWYYHFIVLALKTPLPLVALIFLGFASYLRQRPTWADACILVPLAAWAYFISKSGIDIGIRHAFPFYAFLILIAARSATLLSSIFIQRTLLLLIAALVFESARPLPWCMSYFNLPYPKPHLLLSDSNIDWGHTLRATKTWIDRNLPHDTPAKIIYWGDPFGPYVQTLVGPQYYIPRQQEMLPPTGYLICSAAVQTLWFEQMGVLNDVTPVASIAGGAAYVYHMEDVWPIAARVGRFPPPLPSTQPSQ